MSSFNPEKVLEYINAINEARDNKNEYHLNEVVNKLTAYTMGAITADAVKKSGGKAAIDRMQAGKRYIKDIRVDCQGAWYKDGYQCLCDGYTGYRFAPGSHIDGLPDITRGNNFDLLGTIGGLRPENVTIPVTYTTITQSGVRSAIAQHKARCKSKGLTRNIPGCNYRAGIAVYNGNYLLETMCLFGVTELTLHQYTAYRGAYIKIGDNEAIIMAIRPNAIDNDTIVYGDIHTGGI